MQGQPMGGRQVEAAPEMALEGQKFIHATNEGRGGGGLVSVHASLLGVRFGSNCSGTVKLWRIAKCFARAGT